MIATFKNLITVLLIILSLFFIRITSSNAIDNSVNSKDINRYAEEDDFPTLTGHYSKTYYVSVDGNDYCSGSKEKPWRTIQKAAGTLKPGEEAIIKPGIYNEIVTVKHRGKSDSERIRLVSEVQHGAKCNGFMISGDYITIEGFEIEADTVSWMGIRTGRASFINIINCNVHDCPMGGITFGSNVSHFIISGNISNDNGQWGININGSFGLVENNSISGIIQHHPKGDSPNATGQDADGIRVFGSGHIIRGNTVVDIADTTDKKHNIDPHSDGIQTWDGGPGRVQAMSYTIIENNYFRLMHPSGKGIMASSNRGGPPCHHLIIRNNIFEFRDIGISAYIGSFNNIFIYNNIFKAYLNERIWGCGIALGKVENYAVLNNITVDCHPTHRSIKGGSGVVDYNLAWNSDGSMPAVIPSAQQNDIIGQDPMFINYTGLHGKNNYHLSQGSPCIDKGMSLKDVPNDFEGSIRPKGKGYDIGAFEYSGE